MVPETLLYILTPMILQTFTPSQLHVSLSDIPNEIVFTWSTSYPTQSSFVRLTQESIWVYFEGTSSLFIDHNTKWYINTVKASLDPDSIYTYQVGCQYEGFSESYSLRTPPNENKAKFVVIGDFSVKDYGQVTWNAVKKNYEEWEIDAVIMLGDLAYDLHSESSTKGDEFMDEIQSVVSTVPLMVCAGNHEKFDNYHNYLNRFAMPNTQFYYTFTVGYARFVAIHTEALVDEREDLKNMLEFLKSVLHRTKSDKKKFPWLIVYGHRPLYCMAKLSGGACGREANIIRKQIEDLLFINNVDLYLNGHVHNYQRSHPVYKEYITTTWNEKLNAYINPRSPIYITNGAAGSDGKNSILSSEFNSDIIAISNDTLSFGILTVENKTHLLWKQLSSETQNEVDSFWIMKNFKIV